MLSPGKVSLDDLPEPPERLRNLFTAQTTVAREFREHIRRYNSTLVFTSFTANEKDINSHSGGPWVLKSGYTIYYRIANILPHQVRDAKYAQLYFYNPNDALQCCMDNNEHLN